MSHDDEFSDEEWAEIEAESIAWCVKHKAAFDAVLAEWAAAGEDVGRGDIKTSAWCAVADTLDPDDLPMFIGPGYPCEDGDYVSEDEF